MCFLRFLFPPRVGLVLTALALVGTIVPVASAGLVSPVLDPCPGAVDQPFRPWADSAYYGLAPNGGLESGSAGWALTGGAQAVAGNESYAVGGSTDRTSLALPAGSTGTTSSACVGTLSPTIRFFVRNTGDPAARLRLDILYTDALGLRWSVPVAGFAGTSRWQPTPITLILANVTSLPLVTGGQAQVAFRLTAVGAGGAFQVDDLYVDPYKGS